MNLHCAQEFDQYVPYRNHNYILNKAADNPLDNIYK